MNTELFRMLKRITPEEKAALDGQKNVQWSIYTDAPQQSVIEHEKLLTENRLITARKHTRFVYFPPHTHDYVEFFCVLSGSITHRVEGRELVVSSGELLLMNQHTEHEILPCGADDLAINLIIMPSFFEEVRQMVGRDNFLAEFMLNILQQEDSAAQYLYFAVADDLCIQNLVENIVYTILCKQHNEERVLSVSVALLFLHLLNAAEQVQIPIKATQEQGNALVLAAEQYIREEYRGGTLNELARRIGYSAPALSRLIKKYTGTTFKELQTKQRMEQVMHLLRDTDQPINEIAASVGYENQSFFYKRFQREFGMSPKEARQKLRNRVT
ncbi:MAG: AraC family transcriptional regulator [Clostridiales bacterium]|nr:AraC family transcriptional regulator [Clostridiales bacterium]